MAVFNPKTLYVCSRQFFDRRMGQEINGEVFGEEYNGYIFRLTGGNDKQGFPMKQGILINGRTRILFKKRKFFSGCPLIKDRWYVLCCVPSCSTLFA